MHCSWAGGRISEAARFIVRALEMAPANARLLAILPDVLRSGSFQHRWRERVSDLASVESVERYGSEGHNLFFGDGGSRIWGPMVERYLAERGVR
jgi:hypothetical protein